MKADIHPNYSDIKVTCSCGNEFTTRSTLGEDLMIEIFKAPLPLCTARQLCLFFPGTKAGISAGPSRNRAT